MPVEPAQNAPKSEEPQPHAELVVEPDQPLVQIEKKAEPPLIDESHEIRQIIVEDNTKTTSATVELISGLKVGDTWDPNQTDEVKSRLISSGLFKDVEVYWTK